MCRAWHSLLRLCLENPAEPGNYLVTSSYLPRLHFTSRVQMRLPISNAITTFSDLKSDRLLHICDFLKTVKKFDAIFVKWLMTKRGSIGGQ